MHEASLAISILQSIQDYEQNNRCKVDKALLEIGKGSGTNVTSLIFCIDELKKSMTLNTVFEIIEKPILGKCDSCKQTVEIDYPTHQCPFCKEIAFNIVEGMDLKILEFEVVENEG